MNDSLDDPIKVVSTVFSTGSTTVQPNSYKAITKEIDFPSGGYTYICTYISKAGSDLVYHRIIQTNINSTKVTFQVLLFNGYASAYPVNISCMSIFIRNVFH